MHRGIADRPTDALSELSELSTTIHRNCQSLIHPSRSVSAWLQGYVSPEVHCTRHCISWLDTTLLLAEARCRQRLASAVSDTTLLLAEACSCQRLASAVSDTTLLLAQACCRQWLASAVSDTDNTSSSQSLLPPPAGFKLQDCAGLLTTFCTALFLQVY